MNGQKKRQLMASLPFEIQICEERQPNGQWLKSIKFKLPMIDADMRLDNDAPAGTVCLCPILFRVETMKADLDEAFTDVQGCPRGRQRTASSQHCR